MRMMGFGRDDIGETPDVMIPPVEVPKEPVRSLVRVRFEDFDRELAYFNDRFDLSCGDRVFVSGKLAGKPGFVTSVTTKFKIKMSDYHYEKVIALAQTPIHGAYKPVADKMLSYDSAALSPEAFRTWVLPPEDDTDDPDDEVIYGDGYEIPLDDPHRGDDVEHATFERALEYCRTGKHSVAYSRFLGYDRGPNGEFVINEKEATIIRRIYEEFLAGLSAYMIAKGLTADGIPTPAHKTVWQASVVTSILTNEKYYGAAILQKTVKEFMTRSRKNTGELPMFYISQDHEPIISSVQFNMVQEEMLRRKEAGNRAQSVSIFSGRIVCGDCGGFYGRKIWHAGSKYASWHWHCNNKFQKRKYCTTPTLKEKSIEECFVKAFNRLVKRRPKIEENYRICLDAITDTSQYEKQLEQLNKETSDVQTLIRLLLTEGSRTEINGSVSKRYKEYEDKLEALSRKKQDLDRKIANCKTKRTQVIGFLMELKKHDHPLKEFDPLVWQAVINRARVDNDCTITFIFRDGTEVKTKITNGVRSYRKPSSEQISNEQKQYDDGEVSK